jgi:KDO2-lipid IV(A) lauroyltransferase
VSDYAEYYALRGAVGALRALGWRGATRMGELIGQFGYAAIRIRRSVTERQIHFAFPDLGERDVRRVARAAYAHLGRTAIEAALLPMQPREFLLELPDVLTGWNVVEEALAEGRGMILVSGHVGNWELGGSWLAAKGLNVAGVARRQRNPLFEKYIGQTRANLGIRIIHEAEAVRIAPRHLRSGGTLGLLADQGVRGLASTYVPFFGKPARTPRGPAVLSIRLDTPLVFGAGYRKPDGHFHFVFERIPAPRSGDLEHDVQQMVMGYTEALERAIRRAPEQYFWMHQRWKHQPPGTAALPEAAT